MIADALVGHTGFVGSTLLRQTTFGSVFRSTTIGQIDGGSFGTVVCAGAPAQKWKANADPDGDAAAIDGLIAHLDSVSCERFVLMSTVDVFADPRGVDESTPVVTDDLGAYGLNRYRLETFARERFDDVLVVRLPGLVGPGLRKNVVYDLLHDNDLHAVDPRGVFQFYPMVNLWSDLQVARAAGLDLVHLTAAPVEVATIAREVFGRTLDHVPAKPPARYDFQSLHAGAFGGADGYQYSVRESLLAMRAYAQSEPA